MPPLRLCLCALALAACAPPAPRPPARSLPSIDTLALRAHTAVLAHDSMRGRGTGDPVTLHAARYIADQCRALGLEPAGPDYLHPVPLVDAGLSGTSRVVVRGADTVTASWGHEFFVTGGTVTQLGTAMAGPARWVGNPDSMPAVLPDLAGAVAVVHGLPDGAEGARLADAGAVAIVALIGDDDVILRIRAALGPTLRFAEPAVSSYAAPIPVVVAGRRLTMALVPVMQGGTRHVTLALAPAPRVVPAWNVACLLPGTDRGRADTAIAFTAHYDHLGVGAPENGDSIYNGFSDNAAGVAMLLAIARTMRATPPRHSALFLFFTAEERGLLGSDWWVAHPAWPIARTRAVINLDAGAPPARVWSWQLAGGADSWLGRVGQDAAAERGWTATLTAARPNSDYFPFHRVGVPAVFPIPTPAPYEGLTTDSSRALRARWDRYHRAGDAWFPDFPLAGIARYAEYALAIARAVDER